MGSRAAAVFGARLAGRLGLTGVVLNYLDLRADQVAKQALDDAESEIKSVGGDSKGVSIQTKYFMGLLRDRLKLWNSEKEKGDDEGIGNGHKDAQDTDESSKGVVFAVCWPAWQFNCRSDPIRSQVQSMSPSVSRVPFRLVRYFPALSDSKIEPPQPVPKNRWPLMASDHPPDCHIHQEILQVDDNEEDRLSALPDDILLNILERLPLHPAVHTSTLSRRWRRLPLLLSHPVIDIAEFRGRSRTRTVQSLMASYTEATERLWAPTRERAVKLLRLAFFLRSDQSYLRSIGHAIAMAAGSGHTELVDLTLWTAVRRSRCTQEHAALYGQLQVLLAFLGACPSAFRCLTSLILRNLELAESDVRNLLSTCDRLRELCLKYCGYPMIMTAQPGEGFVLKIDAPSSQLVTLRIVECYFAQKPRLPSIAFMSRYAFGSVVAKISRHICGRNKVDFIAEKTNLLCEARDFKHSNLKFVEIEGFQPEKTLIGYTRLVMERLKRIRLLAGKDDCKPCDHLRPCLDPLIKF
ncbi:hypothetical protein BAE44_0020529 [Dichanthelium oligosanthes]|uniref:F-box domain-containing protein n=1 Tax=Dichanthelium oligosanthes TaxID=888268 RepID=A0A1E5UZW2_9POAL|nr:hypothetical protein BAE44_0020529 [Dichanthelium oligosanthes]